MKKLILGSPGTGKTTTLIKLIKEYLDRGVDIDRIGFFTFSKSACKEALKRLGTDLEPKYFRTLHSLAFKLINCQKNSVMQWGDYDKIAKKLGLPKPHRGHTDMNGSFANLTNIIKFAEEQGRLRGSYESMMHLPYNPKRLAAWAEELLNYKKKFIKLDYIDMIRKASELEDDFYPTFDVVFIDEAQDLNRFQWEMVYKLMANTTDTFIAGDDDQCIFEFVGADLKNFLALKNEFIVQTLERSYRVPSFIWGEANKLIRTVSERYQKNVEPAEGVGDVWTFSDERYIEQFSKELQGKSILVLARTKYKVNKLKISLESWFKGKEDIRFMTIHEAKGQEADVVILDMGLSQTVRRYISLEQETKLFYVGMTRAKQLLICVDRKNGFALA